MARLDWKELRRLVHQDPLRFGLLGLFATILIGVAGAIGGLIASYSGAGLAMITVGLLLGVLVILFGDRWIRSDLERDQEWFKKNLPVLLSIIAGEYVAVIDRKIVAHDLDLGVVTQEVYTRYERRPIFIHKVETLHIIALPLFLDEGPVGE